jgi:hypothetical protein
MSFEIILKQTNLKKDLIFLDQKSEFTFLD